MSKPVPQIVPLGGGTGVEHADWAEAYLILSKLPRLSRSELREQFALDDDPDVQIDMLLNEVQRRETIASHGYPFAMDGTGVARRTKVAGDAYDFLVLACVSPYFRKKGNETRFKAADVIFDNIVREAARWYLGAPAAAVRFGSPATGDRPANFPDAVKWLGKQMGIAKGPGTPKPRSRDGGVDVAAWRRFGDKRTGFAVLLVQATLQPEGKWLKKGTDVVEGRWFGWLDLGRPPVTGLAVPYALGPKYEMWDDLRRTVTLVLDRLRIIELLPQTPETDAMRTKWIAAETKALLR